MLTITAAAESHDLTTLDALKAELQISGSGTDDRLSAIITQASDAIATWCRRVFALETVREVIRPTRLNELIVLERFPVTEVTVTIDGAEVAAAKYEADLATGQLLRLTAGDAVGVWGCQAITIDYSAGFVLPGDETPNLPPAIERAARELSQAYWSSLTRDPAIRSEEIPGLAAVAYRADAMPSAVQALIAPFVDRRAR